MDKYVIQPVGDGFIVIKGTKSYAVFYERKKAEEWCAILNGDKKVVNTTLWDDFLDFMDGTYEEEED